LLRQVIYFWLKWVSKSADVAIQPFDGSTIWELCLISVLSEEAYCLRNGKTVYLWANHGSCRWTGHSMLTTHKLAIAKTDDSVIVHKPVHPAQWSHFWTTNVLSKASILRYVDYLQQRSSIWLYASKNGLGKVTWLSWSCLNHGHQHLPLRLGEVAYWLYHIIRLVC
jgi:hypothetical protein